MSFSVTPSVLSFSYLIATVLFIFSLHWMNDPKTARRAVLAGSAAMTIAVLSTWGQAIVVHHLWIVIAIIAGFRGRCAALDGPDDRSAPADSAVARVRRRRRRTGGDGEVLSLAG